MRKIHAERDSVCMADDCFAPNAAELGYAEGEMLSGFMGAIAHYVPVMRDCVWSVFCGGEIVAHIAFDGMGRHTYELMIPDRPVAELPEQRVHCTYFHSASPAVSHYSELPTLLEKVRAFEAEHGHDRASK